MARHSLTRLAAAASLSALTGCGNPSGGPTPQPGTLTVDVKPAASAVAGLTLTSCKLEIEGLTVFGDVAPDGRSMVGEFTLDALSSGASFSLSMLPQGVYSRVRFNVDQLSAAGTWGGTALSVSLEGGDNSAVDLRSNGVEVAAGHDGALALGVDAGSLFAGNLLDGATVASNQILINGTSNTAVGAQLRSRIPASFTLQDSPSPLK